MSCPTDALMADARRVLRYLELNKSLGLGYEANQRELDGFSDSNWSTQHSILNFACVFGYEYSDSVAG